MNMGEFTNAMIRLDENDPDSDISNSDIPVMIINKEGVIFSIKDVELEYDEDCDSNTVWIQVEEF